ncbi:MAG TPA: hypothetical protein VGD68_07620 [Streptosporangiaceae bacterium]
MNGQDDPFALLGLPARAGQTDDDVKAAWRRVAAATHPDREDGGDPARFGAAAAAYVLLRTSFGRGEALADLSADGYPRPGRHTRGGTHRGPASRPNRGRETRRRMPRIQVPRPRMSAGRARAPGGRVRLGRGLAIRVASAAAVAAATVAAVGLTPATIGLLTGALTVIGWALWRQGGWGR